MNIPKSLLLVVDAQKGFMNEATRPVVPRINQLIQLWRQRNWPVACSRFVNLPGSNWERLRYWHEMQAEPQTLLADGLEADTPYIFEKSTYSAWSDEVIAVCESHQADDVVIVGVDTNECVLATALSVFDAGYRPWVVEDCCASGGGRRPHQTAISLMMALLGEQQIVRSKDLA